MWLLGDAHYWTTLLPEKVPQVWGSDGSEIKVSLEERLEDFLIFRILKFLYNGYEAWASIIRDIRGKIILLSPHRHHQPKP